MGEVCEVVKGFLTQEEYLCIPEHVRKKVDIFVQKQTEEVTVYRALLHSQKQDYEQQISDLENSLSSKCEEYFATKKELNNALVNVDDLQMMLQSLRSENSELVKKTEMLEKQCKDYKSGHDAAIVEKDNARRELEQRLCEIQVCHSEIESLTQKYEGVLAENCKILREAGELRTKETELKVREKELDDERNMFKQQISSLKDELKKSLEQHSYLERENVVRRNEFEMHLSHKGEELRILQEANEELHSSIEKLKEQLESSKQFVAQEHKNLELLQENHLREIEAHKKMVNEYKGLRDNAVAKAQYFEDRLSAMQKIMEEAMEQHEKLVNTVQETNKYLQQSQKESQEERGKLKQELEAANDLVKTALKESLEREIEDLSPLLATVKRMIKPGARITQIFVNNAELLRELELEQNRNCSLQKHMDAIIEELESRTPVMKIQKHELAEAILQNTEMELKFKEILTELMKLRLKVACEKTNEHLDDEDMEHSTNEDNDVNKKSGLKDGTPGVEISENCRDIADIVTYLQTRQTFHLPVGHTEPNPNKFFGVNSAVDNERLPFRQSLEGSSRTINRISFEEPDVSRASQEDQLALFHQQLHHLTKRLESKSVKIKDMASQTDLLPPDENLLKLQKSNESKDEVIRDLQNRVGREEHLRKQLEEQMTQGASMAAQLQVAQDGLKVLQANTTGYKTKLVEVEKKSRNYCTTIAKQESIIQQLKHTLEDMQRRFEHADLQIKGLQRDNEMMRNMQIRTAAQQELLSVGQQKTDMIFSHLEKLQTSINQSEAEGQLRLQNSLKTYIAECADLKMKLQKSEEDFSKERMKLQGETESLRKERCALRQQVETLERRLTEREVQIAEFSSVAVKTAHETEKHQIEAKVDRTDVLMRKYKESELELSNYKVKLATTEELLETSRKHAVIYKDSCLKLEKDHQKLIEDFNLFKENAKKRDEAAVKLEATLCQKISNLQSDLEAAKSFETKFEEAKKELESYKVTVDNLKSELDDLHSQKLAAEVKYSQQILAHRGDEKVIADLREKAKSLEMELEDCKIAKVKAEGLLDNKKETWNKMEKLWKQEHQELSRLIDSLSSRNSNLYKQLGEVSAKALTYAQTGVANTAKRKRSDTEETEPVPAEKEGVQKEVKDTSEDVSGLPPPCKKALLSNETDAVSSDAGEIGNQSFELCDMTSLTKKYEELRSIIKTLQNEKNAVSVKSRTSEDRATAALSQKEPIIAENDITADKQKRLEEDLLISARQSNTLKNETLNSLSETNLRFLEERDALEKQLKVMRGQCAVLEARLGEKDKTELETEKVKVQVLQRRIFIMRKRHHKINKQATLEKVSLLRENEFLRRVKKLKNNTISNLRKRLRHSFNPEYKMHLSEHEQNVSEMSEVDDYTQSNAQTYEYEDAHENQECHPQERQPQRREDGTEEDDVCLVDLAEEEDNAGQVAVEAQYQDPLYTNDADAGEYQAVEHSEYNTHSVNQYTDAADDTHYAEHSDDPNYEHMEDSEFHHRNGEAEYVAEDERQPYVCSVEQEYVEEEHEDPYDYDEEFPEAEPHDGILHQHGPVESEGVIPISRAVTREEMDDVDEEDDEDDLDDDEEEEVDDNIVTVLDSEDAESEEHSTNENLQRLLRSGNISLVKRKEPPRNPDIPGNGS